MSAAPEAPARRVSAPRWTDRRIIVGAVIVICSVTGVAGVVHNANDTVDLWAFRSDLAAGSRVTAQDVARVAARVPDPATYLAASQSPVGETVARPVAAGELVAGSSLQPPRMPLTSDWSPCRSLAPTCPST